MASPPASTPGDAREDHAQLVAAAVAAVYVSFELVAVATVATLARKVAVGTMAAQLAQGKLTTSLRIAAASSALRVRAVLGREPGASLELLPLLDGAVEHAVADAQETLAAAIRAADEPEPPAVTRRGLPGTALSLKRVQATQRSLDRLGVRGLSGYTDHAGRRWNLPAYAEMATRTAVSNAWDERQAARLIRAGVDLVIVGTHSSEGSCPRCLPWLGTTLSLTGATPSYPTLAEAKAAGFRHPNCRCYWASCGVALPSGTAAPEAIEEAAAAYKASQRRRAAVRRIRDAHRRVAVAITPAARAKARRDLEAVRVASLRHPRGSRAH